MTTPRIRSLVSFAAALTVTFTIGCAGTTSRLAQDETAFDTVPHAIRFDNDAREYVHVYLIGALQEWHLGRVAPGARATLRIPVAALAPEAGPIRLAVLTGDGMTLRAASETRAATMIAQPVAEILSQRWAFSQITATGQLTSLRIWSARAEVGRQ